tara:strand:+ start:1139 stop:2200 length:1062 start_codon:yes stop_codon:yes gene_type:complete
MGGGGTQVSTSTTAPWEEQIPYLTGGFEAAKKLFNKGVPEYYPGPTVAGFDPATTAAHKATLGYAMGPRAARMQKGAEGALGKSLAGYTGFSPGQTKDLLAGNVRTGAGTPYRAMENALTQGVIGNLQKNILPGIRQQQMMYQPGGSSAGAQQQNRAVTEATASGLTKPLADMYNNAYQTAQGMRLPASNQITGQMQFGQQQYPTTMNAPLNMYGAMGDVGAQRRAHSQAGMDARMDAYNYRVNAPQNALKNYMAMVTGDYGSTGTQTSPGKSGMDQMGQAIGIAASLFGMSDSRMKENVEFDGTWKGHNVYTYNFKGSNTRSRGVMAQEIEITRPDAVVEIEGIKHVNYGVL